MEDSKNRRIQTLAIALVVNVVFTTFIVGFLIYKVHSLDDKVIQLQNDLQLERSSLSESSTSMIRRKRSDSVKETNSCKSCHRACVQLFGLGSAAKVSLKQRNATAQDVVCVRGERGVAGPAGVRGRRGRAGYIGKPGKRGPPGPEGPRGERGKAGKAFTGNISKLLEKIDIPTIKRGPPSSITVREGANISLPCHAIGFPQPLVTWYKDGKHVSRKKYDRDSGILKLPNIQFSDRGSYKCDARSFLGFDTATVKIIVEVYPRFQEKPSTFLTGYETWETKLTCDIFGFPPPKITWTRTYLPLPIGRHIFAGKDLIITGTRKEDRGPYMCRGDNHLGHVIALIMLFVDPVIPPVITLALPPVTAVTKLGQEVTFRCAARGSPVPTLEWTRDGVVISTNRTNRTASEIQGELVVPNFRVTDQGAYRCFFKNYENGTAEVTTKAHLVGCGDPGVPLHGHRIGDDFWAGQLVVFACDVGYRLEGPSDRLCLENGNWSEFMPTCESSCRRPAPFENGFIVGGNFSVGENVTYVCNKGYWLRGPSVRVCDKTGNWSGSDPFCEGHEFEPSQIISNPEYYDHLRGWLEPVGGVPAKWALCYRATSYGWSGSTFHSNCDNKGPTVTFVRVGQYIFGGYTDQNWQSSGYTESVNSFLFSFKNRYNLDPFMLPVKTTDKAIYGGSSYGPLFGGGHDLYIANSAGSNSNSQSNLGHSYMLPAGYTYGSSTAQRLLAGSSSFTPNEVEVFYQTYKS